MVRVNLPYWSMPWAINMSHLLSHYNGSTIICKSQASKPIQKPSSNTSSNMSNAKDSEEISSEMPFLVGTLKIIEREDGRRLVINGSWGFSGKGYSSSSVSFGFMLKLDFCQPSYWYYIGSILSQKFMFERTVQPSEETGIVLGPRRFESSFELEGDTICEEGVVISFDQMEDKESFLVRGGGKLEITSYLPCLW